MLGLTSNGHPICVEAIVFVEGDMGGCVLCMHG